jgi:hypothetical protein
MMGGDIVVQSVVNEGSTFVVYLPQEVRATTSSADPPDQEEKPTGPPVPLSSG